MEITFAAAVNNREILDRNLLASPCLRSPHSHQILIQENFPSATKAYNDAIQRATNELIVFVHQDMFLPDAWLSQLRRALHYLDRKDPNWGVLGCWGATQSGEYRGHVYSSGWGVLGKEFEHPMPVQTLDEIVLILRKNSNLLFDERLPHFHFYGADICMQAAKYGLRSYAISAFCIHNTVQILELPKEFYHCYAHIKRLWKNYLPIQTTCMRISRFDSEMYKRRIKDICRHTLLLTKHPAKSAKDPGQILEDLATCRSLT